MDWRTIGPLPYAQWSAELRTLGSPILLEGEAPWRAAGEHSALCLAQCLIESRAGTEGGLIDAKNPLGLRPRPGDPGPVIDLGPGKGRFRRFATWTDAIRYWYGKITDPNYAYAATRTVEEYVHVYAPAFDGNDEEAYVRRIGELLARWHLAPAGVIPMTLTIERALVHRPDLRAALTRTDALITIHNTGNNAPRAGERNFVASGGGWEGVAYHFAVDETGVTQILPLWQQGVHAGNVEGNQTSIAIEMCELREPWSAIEEHTAQLLVALVTRDPRLDWTGAERYHFSLDRVVGHRNWAGANPNCPRRLIARYGNDAVEVLVRRARQILAARTPTPPEEPMSETPSPEVLKWLFGRIKYQGHTYTYSPVGAISALWRETSRKRGVYPRLLEVAHIGDDRVFRFEGGFTIIHRAGSPPEVL